MTHARRAASLTAGSAAVIALIATPASAHLQAGSSPAASGSTGAVTVAEQVMHRFGDDTLTLAELQAILDAKLDALAARVAADRAQWAEIASSTVLSSAQRWAAV